MFIVIFCNNAYSHKHSNLFFHHFFSHHIHQPRIILFFLIICRISRILANFSCLLNEYTSFLNFQISHFHFFFFIFKKKITCSPSWTLLPPKECKLVQPLWRTVWRFLKKLEIELPYDPAIPLLDTFNFWKRWKRFYSSWEEGEWQWELMKVTVRFSEQHWGARYGVKDATYV